MRDTVDTSWRDHALDVLRRSGHRSAQARSALIDLLEVQPCALTAREIDDALRAAGHGIGLASVYRNLDRLVELKLVGRLDVGQGVARYERLLPTGEHHHHLVCDRCGRVTPFDDRALEQSIERLSRKVNFQVAEHDVVLHGACAACGD
ncbi:MAG: Fur family transcriptional regulator, ferric uptake regulator [Thermoleophilaceae bacterium]|jgi:Fur family ferric uptake transcriptional regulator|nr:Fur family transcriptional regulator, ferric uptake regulator [Thermoleophilaceae bacterium]